MATRVTGSRDSGHTFGQEEYSLYSSLSEDELIQMAVEQSLSVTSSSSAQPPGSTVPTHPRALARAQAQGNHPAVRALGPQPCPKNREPDPVAIAISKGDEEALKRMIQAGKNLCTPNPDGWIPLHEAVFYNKPGCVKLLLSAYPGTVDCRTLGEETALYLATSRGYVECMICLLEAGAECDITNKTKETALYKACENKNVEVVKLLVKFNADVNHRCNRGWTALHEAVVRNDLDIIEALITAGAKIESTNAYGVSPLFVAAQSGQLEALRFLVKHGADVNTQANDNASALYEASKNEHTDIVEFLLSQNADANKGNKDGWLPLHIAAARGNMDLIEMLLPVTSKVRVRRSGISPLHLAAQHNHVDVMEELIEAGYNINALLSPERSRLFEDKRTSVLYFAVYNNNVEATEILLKAGANPNVDLINPLLIAIRHGSIRIIQLLMSYGANINAYIPTHPTSFPATIMFCMKYLSLLKLIMDYGGDAESCFNCEYGNCQHPEQEQRRPDTVIEQKHRKVVQSFKVRPKLHVCLTCCSEEVSQSPQPLLQLSNGLPEKGGPVHLVQIHVCPSFCEIISTDRIYRWAGPIIDVLLDYVGNVTLCSKLKEHLDSYEEWATIKAKSEPPRPLVHLCRIKIRKLLGHERLKLIELLPLPGRLRNYLEYNYTNEFA
ncbi:ankyrin repeat and SOCS box protein 2 isoform X2 [Mobula hypostoma]|uniref:ankyrin repeat and SOCS box protein 2 isoform X2 n=1 Tax=Mobula hypostoma TaxID=723540 RepID=UPI002FC3DCB3